MPVPLALSPKKLCEPASEASASSCRSSASFVRPAVSAPDGSILFHAGSVANSVSERSVVESSCICAFRIEHSSWSQAHEVVVLFWFLSPNFAGFFRERVCARAFISHTVDGATPGSVACLRLRLLLRILRSGASTPCVVCARVCLCVSVCVAYRHTVFVVGHHCNCSQCGTGNAAYTWHLRRQIVRFLRFVQLSRWLLECGSLWHWREDVKSPQNPLFHCVRNPFACCPGRANKFLQFNFYCALPMRNVRIVCCQCQVFRIKIENCMQIK